MPTYCTRGFGWCVVCCCSPLSPPAICTWRWLPLSCLSTELGTDISENFVEWEGKLSKEEQRLGSGREHAPLRSKQTRQNASAQVGLTIDSGGNLRACKGPCTALDFLKVALNPFPTLIGATSHSCRLPVIHIYPQNGKAEHCTTAHCQPGYRFWPPSRFVGLSPALLKAHSSNPP